MSPFFVSRLRFLSIKKKVRTSEQSVPLAAQSMVNVTARGPLGRGGVQVSN